jgi:hypothetical protein
LQLQFYNHATKVKHISTSVSLLNSTKHHLKIKLGGITSKGEGRYGNIMCYLLLTLVMGTAIEVVDAYQPFQANAFKKLYWKIVFDNQ